MSVLLVDIPAEAVPVNKPLPWRWVVAVVLSCTVIVGFSSLTASVLRSSSPMPISVTAMGTGFNPVLMGTLMTAFRFPYAFSAPPLSFTGDIFAPRRLLIAVASIWGTLMIAMGAATSYGFMLVFRFLLGVAEGPQFSWDLEDTEAVVSAERETAERVRSGRWAVCSGLRSGFRC